jgi:7-cyano-7-deazaguanine synthase in queuosine biosynthesis
MRQFEFACGGIDLGTPEAGVVRVALDVQGNNRNVNLRISDISRSLVNIIPDLLLDVLEVAAYVYCSDQRASRGSDKLSEAGESWRRAMRFFIPVRCPEVWTSPTVTEALVDTLSFLSDDLFEFRFIPAVAPNAQPAAYFPEFSEGNDEVDEIALFSGGLDSLAGAIEAIAGERKRTVLIGHHSSEKVFAVQKDLVWHLKHAGDEHRALYIPVNVTNAGVKAIESTQRARSFLYASLAFVLARMFGRDGFTFYENGVVSFNLPMAGDVLGARATRTTHPRVIRGFEAIFSELAEGPISIRTPFLWLTKKDVVERIVKGGFAHLLTRTVSCAHPRTWTTEVRHCGVCSQCIDRRFAILAANAGPFEPISEYAIDLLTGDRSRDEEVRMAVAYVKFCRTIADGSREMFTTDYPAVISALGDLPGSSSREALDQIWDLHRRHAFNVLGVVQTALNEHAPEMVRGKLPARSLLSLCFSRNRIEPVPMLDVGQQLSELLDRLSPPACEFAVDKGSRRILFKGDFHLDGASFKLVRALLDPHRSAKAASTDVPFVKPRELAETLYVDEQSLRQQITRTRAKFAERLTVDQGIVLPNGFIETGTRLEGYRLSPEAREVSPADLLRPTRSVSQYTRGDVTDLASKH